MCPECPEAASARLQWLLVMREASFCIQSPFCHRLLLSAPPEHPITPWTSLLAASSYHCTDFHAKFENSLMGHLLDFVYSSPGLGGH